MTYYFPAINGQYSYLQTNRSDVLGSLWSSFNLDFQTNLGTMRLAQKLVTTTTSTSTDNLGRASAFEYFGDSWYAICGTRVFTNGSEAVTSSFSENLSGYAIGDSTTQFDITNVSGSTYRYTYDGNGTDPGITAISVPIGTIVEVQAQNFASGNKGTFTVTGSGSNYFQVTNASGSAESDKTIGNGYISVINGTFGTNYNSDRSDLGVFDGRIWASSEEELYSKGQSGRWTKRDDLSTGVHKISYLKKFNRLYYVYDETSIRSIDSSNVVADSGDYFLDIGNSLGIITTMVSTSNNIWIGTMRQTDSATGNGTQGTILQWDGISAQITEEYDIQAGAILSLTIYQGVVYAVDSEGRILKQTGYSFDEIGRLPVDRTLLIGATVETSTNGRFIHYNGFVPTKNETLLVAINNLNDDNAGTINENLPSGIWEFDLNTTSFTHRYSFTLKTLASSTVTDYGQNRIVGIGALKMNTLGNTTTAGRSTLICGSTFYTDATTTKSAIFIDNPVNASTDTEGQKRGYFVTTWFNSNEVVDKFNRLWTTFRRFLNSTDKMIFKYRLNEESPVYATITWTSTTTFTTTTDVSSYAPTAEGFNTTTGGEVEIIQGTGGGSCTHISSITENAGTYTVTLDNEVTGVTGTAKARFQKWIKMYPEITGQVNSWAQPAIGADNVRIEIKGVMEWTGADEFFKFTIIGNEDIKANK